MIRSRVFITFTLLLTAGLVVMFLIGAHIRSRRMQHHWPAQKELVQAIQLTDLAIWTEARYTRHPSQADRFAAFQDLPSSLEHFPAGSVVAVSPDLASLGR